MFFCAGHLFHFFSSQHSVKVGVLFFDGFGSHVVTVFFLFSVYSENSEQGAQRRGRVSVSWNALTAVQMPETGCTAHRGCNMFFCAGHLFSLCFSSQHSEKVGVLVSMVLVLTLLLCSSFSRFTVKTLSRELRDVHV